MLFQKFKVKLIAKRKNNLPSIQEGLDFQDGINISIKYMTENKVEECCLINELSQETVFEAKRNEEVEPLYRFN